MASLLSIGLALVGFFMVLSVNAQFAADTDPPIITLCPQPVSYTVTKDDFILLEFTPSDAQAQDAGSGIRSVEITIEPNSKYPQYPYVPSSENSVYVAIGNSVKVTWTFTDNAGNVAECKITRYVIAQVTDIWCLQNPCLNGGTCRSDQFQEQPPYCFCSVGFYGEFCQLVDNEPPVITNCPGPVEGFVPEGSYDSLVAWREPEATDDTASINIVKNRRPLSKFEAGATEVVYSFTDEARNTAYCRFTVNIYVGDYVLYDKEGPTIYHCPSNSQVVISIPPGETQTMVGWQEPWARRDNTGKLPEKRTNIPPMSMFPLGRTPVEYVFTDGLGNSAYCNFDIIVINEDSPALGQNDWEIVDCPRSIVMANIPVNEESVIVTWNEPRAVSLYGQTFAVTKTYSPMSSFPRGGTEVVYTFTAADRAQEECKFTIFITPGIDAPPAPVIADPSLAPIVINCPRQIGGALPIGTYEAIVNWVEPEARSPVNKPVLVTKSTEPGSLFRIRTLYTIEYIFTDSDGLSSSCMFEILLTVGPMEQTIPTDDNTEPKVYNCPDNIESTTQYTSNEAAVTWEEPFAIDNTRITPAVWKTHQPLDKFRMGRTQVVYRFEDLSGNAGVCVFTIDISIDNEKPSVSNCPHSFIVPLTMTNQDYIRLYFTDPIAIGDNYGTPATIVEQTFYPGDALPYGVSAVTYTFADQANNVAVCSFDITVTAPPGTSACPGGAQPFRCLTNPCREEGDGSLKSCPAQPDAECRANYCGGCNAVFYDRNNNVVDCNVVVCTYQGITYGDFASLDINRCSDCICFSGQWYCRQLCDEECPLMYPGDSGICDFGGTPIMATPCSSHGDCYMFDSTSKCCPNVCGGGDYCTKRPGSHCVDRSGYVYNNGEWLSSGDESIRCTCTNGDWLCKEELLQCSYSGNIFVVGESRMAEDGCNRCSCTESGWKCTEIACAGVRRNRRSTIESSDTVTRYEEKRDTYDILLKKLLKN